MGDTLTRMAPAPPTGRSFRAAAPVRLDLAGGWTDVPPFSAREGGIVVTASVQLFAHAQLSLEGIRFRLISEDLHEELEVESVAGLVRDGRLELLKAGLRMFPVGPCTLTTRSDAPPGSGLGSSGALDVALVSALAAARAEILQVEEIAEAACRLEAVEAGIPGGRQDQFAAAHGGFLRLEFRDPDASVLRMNLDSEFAAELERRMVLCYTSASHFSGATIDRVMRAYERGERSVAGALHGLREVAESMATALGTANFVRVGQLLTENWRHQQALDPRMRTDEMAVLERAVTRAGALGGKAAGSGAGGCMFFLAPDRPAPVIQAALECGARLLPVRWAREGARSC